MAKLINSVHVVNNGDRMANKPRYRLIPHKCKCGLNLWYVNEEVKVVKNGVLPQTIRYWEYRCLWCNRLLKPVSIIFHKGNAYEIQVV